MMPQYGEGFVGAGPNAAHVNTVLGLRDGPVGQAWAAALASPSAGHVPFVAVHRPNLPVVPFTLFVNKASIEGELHGTLTWGAAQAGIAAGVALAREDGVFGDTSLASLALIAAVWVNPAADDEEAVFANNRDGVLAALRMGAAGGPDLAAFAAAGEPTNPYFRA